MEYEEEINRQRKLLDIVWKPEIKSHCLELPHQHVCKEEEDLTDQQLCTQQRSSSLDQEDPEPPQIKEEQEEVCTSQEGERLELKEETDTFMFTSTHEESEYSEDQTLNFNPDDTLGAADNETSVNMPVIICVVTEAHRDQQLLSHSSHGAESQDQEGGKHGGSGSTEEAESKKNSHKSRSQSDNVNIPNLSDIYNNTHTDKKYFKCETCGKGFKHKSSQERHLRVHTGERPYICKTCGKEFGYNSVLLAHMRIHTGEKPFTCTICGKDFTYKHDLIGHMRIHTGEKPCSCKICGKDFRLEKNLLVHMRIHTGEKPYICKSCGKKFCSVSALINHRKIHTGKKPFICKICGKDFGRNRNLLVHMRTHTSEKLYICEKCGKNFRCSSNLMVHMRRALTGEKPRLCKTCGKRFFTVFGLVRHKRVHTDKQFSIGSHKVKSHIITALVGFLFLNCQNRQNKTFTSLKQGPSSKMKHFCKSKVFKAFHIMKSSQYLIVMNYINNASKFC